jgi:tetratricopeptide (TPR) repeat protein
MLSLVAQRGLTLVLLVTVLGGAVAGLGWYAWNSPRSRFLPPGGDAEWIHYPASHQVTTFAYRYEQHATFRRTFELPAAPAQARLRVRAFQGCSVELNGQPVELPAAEHWNRVRTCDVTPLLRAGTNQVRAVAWNDVGPPVLWLVLDGPGFSIASDEQWTATLDGAVERPAHLAREPVPRLPGSAAAGGNQTVPSLIASLPALFLVAALSAAVLLVVALAVRRQIPLRLFGREVSPLTVGLAAACLAWVALFLHNTFRTARFVAGFDGPMHVEYVQYILDHGSLPLADEGWETHHPPLYYLVAAGLLRVCGLSTLDEESAVAVLRLFGLALGLAELALIAASLRLLFPGQPRRQLGGLLLAAVVPAHIYCYYYTSNEPLLTTLGTAGLFLCLLVLRDESVSVGRHALLGLCLGGALLTKLTGLVVAGSVLLVLAGRLIARGERRPGVWLRSVGVVLALTVAVSAWHYARVWAHFGTPFVGNYDTASGFWWWQMPGFGTLAYLLRFGRVLTDPFFSASNGFPDGLYATFWGDGMCGGVGAWAHRPPWNYELIAAGYLLALLPTLAILLGLGIALWQFLRRPRAEWFLLFGVPAGLAVAVLFQMVRYPYDGHSRASYLLTAMLPVCAVGALGVDCLARLGRVAAAALAVLLGTWALTAYASFWIVPGSAAALTWAGEQAMHRGWYFRARVSLREAVDADPGSVPARINLVRALLATNEKAEARRVIDGVLRDAPEDPDALLFEAAVCQAEGRILEQVAPLVRASELAPEHPALYGMLGGALMQAGRDDEAIAAYRQGLRVAPWEPAVHANLALVLARTGQTEEALHQYRLALQLCPVQPDWPADIAWLLATQQDPRLRQPEEALRLATEACERSEYRDPLALRALAAAQAACHRYGEARETAGRAARAAARRSALEESINEQLQCYARNEPYYARGPLRQKPYDPLINDDWPRANKG